MVRPAKVLSLFAQDERLVTVTMGSDESMEIEDTMRYLGFRPIATGIGHEEAVEMIEQLEESNYNFDSDFAI